jgi:Tol biopolymer transport system component
MNTQKLLYRLSFIVLILCIFFITSPSKAQHKNPVRDPEQARQFYLGNFKTAQDYRFPGEETEVEVKGTQWAPMWSRITYSTLTPGNADIYSVIPFNNPYLLTSSVWNDLYPSLSHGGEKLAFVSDRTKKNKIYSLDINTGVISQLTSNSGSDLYPAWDYSDSRIAFQSNQTENYEIYMMNSDGTNFVQLTFNNGYDGEPSWSRDGSKITFTSNRTGIYEIWVMDANGDNQHQVTTHANAFTPSFSPVADKIAYSADSDGDGFFDEVWTINLDGTSPTKLFDRGEARDRWRPSWSPDGSWLGFIGTDWIKYKGNWYWTQSLLLLRDLSSEEEYNEFADKEIWGLNWASMDAQPPSACNISTPSYTPSSFYTLNWSATDEGESGIASYYLQTRSDDNSNWVDLLSAYSNTSYSYHGLEEGFTDFRCKAKDNSGNVIDWSEAPITRIYSDELPPISQVEIPDREIRGASGTVNWSGEDKGWGVESYDIWVKDGLNANWSLWLDGVTQTSDTYSGEIGRTYYFRSQAIDQAGHIEAWQPSPQDRISFYSDELSVNTFDIRNHLIGEHNFRLIPTEIYSSTQNIGTSTFYLSNSPTTTISITSTGFGTLPQTIITTTSDTSINIALPPQIDLIQNGTFETGTLSGWNSSDGTVSVVSDTWHTGSNALEIKHEITATSQITQAVTIDPAMHQPIFSFFYSIPNNLMNGYFRVDIIDDETHPIIITDTTSSGWQHFWADLSDFSGETITVSMEFSGTNGIVNVDDVSIGAWETPIIQTITPNEWFWGNKPTLSIYGRNFINSPSVILDNIVLNPVTWVSDTLLTVNIPFDLSEGIHSIRVENPSGISDYDDNAIQVKIHRAYLPLLYNSTGNFLANFGEANSSGWLTLGQNIAHTGYNEMEPGARRYSLAWQTNLPYADYGGAEDIAVSDGVLVVSSDKLGESGGILAFDAATGQTLWRHDYSYIYTINPASISHGRVYFQVSNISMGSKFFSLDLNSGNQNWNVLISSDMDEYLSPLIVDDTAFFVTGIDNTGIRALNLANSQNRWIKSIRCGLSNCFYGWVPAYENGKVYAWTGGIFTELNATNGDEMWYLNVGWSWHGLDMDTAPVISNNKAFVTSLLGLNAIDLNHKQVSWTSDGNYDDTLVATDGQFVYALHEKILEERSITDGALLWSFTFDNNLQRAPVLTPNYLYVATSDKTYIFDRTTHLIVWQTNHGGWITVANGFLYIVNGEKVLFAYRAEEP